MGSGEGERESVGLRSNSSSWEERLVVEGYVAGILALNSELGILFPHAIRVTCLSNASYTCPSSYKEHYFGYNMFGVRFPLHFSIQTCSFPSIVSHIFGGFPRPS